MTAAEQDDGFEGRAFGPWGHIDGNGNAAHFNRSTGGFFIGAGTPVFDTWRFGAVTCYSHTNFDVGWRHANGDVTPSSTMRFAGGDAFSVVGVPITRHAAVVEAGLDFALAPAAVLGVSYGGQLGSGLADQSVKATFNVKF